MEERFGLGLLFRFWWFVVLFLGLPFEGTQHICGKTKGLCGGRDMVWLVVLLLQSGREEKGMLMFSLLSQFDLDQDPSPWMMPTTLRGGLPPQLNLSRNTLIDPEGCFHGDYKSSPLTMKSSHHNYSIIHGFRSTRALGLYPLGERVDCKMSSSKD